MTEKIIYLWQYYDSTKPLNVLMLGESFCDKNYIIKRSRENFLSFEYIIDGCGTLEINGKVLHPKKNDVYMLTKYSEQKYWADPDEPWTKIWVAFNGPMADALFDFYLPKNVYLVENCNILPYMQEIIRIANTQGANYDNIVDEIAVILLKICTILKNHLQRKTDTVPEKMKQWLDLNVEKTVTLNQLCEQCGYTKNRLITLFKEVYGITPYRYLRIQKIEMAKRYLCNTNLSVKEIALRLSFADAQYFSGCFKTETGVSPIHFRSQLGK